MYSYQFYAAHVNSIEGNLMKIYITNINFYYLCTTTNFITSTVERDVHKTSYNVDYGKLILLYCHNIDFFIKSHDERKS